MGVGGVWGYVVCMSCDNWGCDMWEKGSEGVIWWRRIGYDLIRCVWCCFFYVFLLFFYIVFYLFVYFFVFFFLVYFMCCIDLILYFIMWNRFGVLCWDFIVWVLLFGIWCWYCSYREYERCFYWIMNYKSW